MTTTTTWDLPTRHVSDDPVVIVHARPPSRSQPGWRAYGLLAWMTLCGLLSARHGLYSWHYFATAGHTMLNPHDALHVYGQHPELQFGPVTMAVSALLAAAPLTGALACLLMLGLGFWSVALLADLGGVQGGPKLPAAGTYVYAFLLSPLWLVLAVHYGHLDDALALFLLTSALVLARRGHWTTAALLLAAATGAKPWILPMAMLLLAAPRPARLKAFGVFLVGTAAPWIPFVLADPGTLHLSKFTISVADDSVLRLLGSAAQATPVWDRPLQFVAGAALSAWLVRKGRWLCVPFAVLSVRLLLDPQTYLYYAAGLALAAAMADLARRRRLPILTSLTLCWSGLAMLLSTFGQPTGAAGVRLVGLLIGLAAIIGSGGWSARFAARPPVRSALPGGPRHAAAVTRGAHHHAGRQVSGAQRSATAGADEPCEGHAV